MKTKQLLLTLLLAVLVPWAAKGQETVTVCDGTATGTTTTEVSEAIGAMLGELGITPSDGDKIISQDEGFLIYQSNGGWTGTINQMKQGHGYIYVSNANQ